MSAAAERSSLAELLHPGAAVERLCGGFTFTEGPVWNHAEGCLYFSDLVGDARWRWSERAGRELVERPTGKGNGMTYLADLTLVVCQQNTSRLLAIRGDGDEVLAAEYEGRELNSPNDVCLHSAGSLYFTDPVYGRLPEGGLERPQALDFQGLYRVAPGDPDPTLIAADFDQPNGLCFSPDESILYVNDTPRAEVRAFSLDERGEATGQRVFAAEIGDGSVEAGPVDGMKCDELGNVWVTGPGGLWVFAPTGERLGLLEVSEAPGNLAWGGPRRDELYICATSSLYRVRTRVRGRREPFMP